MHLCHLSRVVLPRESQAGPTALEEKQSVLATSSNCGKTAAEVGTAVGRLEDHTEGENVFDQESMTRGGPAELLPRETQSTSAVALKEKQSVLATLPKHREDPMEKTIALHPPANTIEQERPRYEHIINISYLHG